MSCVLKCTWLLCENKLEEASMGIGRPVRKLSQGPNKGGWEVAWIKVGEGGEK